MRLFPLRPVYGRQFRRKILLFSNVQIWSNRTNEWLKHQAVHAMYKYPLHTQLFSPRPSCVAHRSMPPLAGDVIGSAVLKREGEQDLGKIHLCQGRLMTSTQRNQSRCKSTMSQWTELEVSRRETGWAELICLWDAQTQEITNKAKPKITGTWLAVFGCFLPFASCFKGQLWDIYFIISLIWNRLLIVFLLVY